MSNNKMKTGGVRNYIIRKEKFHEKFIPDKRLSSCHVTAIREFL